MVCPNPDSTNMLYTTNCIRHFNSGCKQGVKNNQEVCTCNKCILDNITTWSKKYDPSKPTTNDKQIIKDCGDVKQIETLLATNPYCGGALVSESDASGWSWWVWLIIGIIILVVLGAILKVVTFGVLGGNNNFSSNSGWYGGYSEDY